VGLLGRLRVDLNATVFAWLLIAELTVLIGFDVAAFLHPADCQISLAPLLPSRLVVDGLGGVLAFGVACYAGFESAGAYGEEARTPRTVSRATFWALGFLGPLYALSSWALAVAVGPDQVAQATREDPGLLQSLLQAHLGLAASAAAGALLVTSILAAMISFHNTVARTVFGLARERIVPEGLARIGTGMRGGAPTRGSAAQSGIALVILGVAVLFAVPPLTVFTWLGTVGGLGLLMLLVATATASRQFFSSGGGTHEGIWVRHIAPVVGMVAGGLVLFAAVANLDSLLGLPPASPVARLVPALIAVTALGGLVHGLTLRFGKPEIYAGISHGRPDPLAVPDQRLGDLEV